MKTNKNISPETIKAYLAGTLSHAQTHEFEKAMLNNAVLRDMVEGYEISRDEEVNFQEVNVSLFERLKKRVGKEKQEIYPLWKRVRLYTRAASVLLVLGIGVYFLTKNNASETTKKVASVQPSEHKNVPQLTPPIATESEAISRGKGVVTKQKMKTEINRIQSEKTVAFEQKKITETDRGGVKADTIISLANADVEPEKSAEVAEKEIVVKSETSSKPELSTTYRTKSSSVAVPTSAPVPVMQNLAEYSAQPSVSPDKYLEYLQKNLRKPKQATENQIVGAVEVEFKVNKKGELSDFKITKSLGYGCDEEAIRLIREGPKWLPKIQGGDTTRQRVRQAVNF